MAALQRQGLDFDGLKQEMDAARRRRKKEDRESPSIELCLVAGSSV